MFSRKKTTSFALVWVFLFFFFCVFVFFVFCFCVILRRFCVGVAAGGGRGPRPAGRI